MLPYPDIDPVALAIGPLKIHWYGIAYLAGIAVAWLLLSYRTRRGSLSEYSGEYLNDVIFYATLGLIIGGRLGSVLFYNFGYYLQHPLDIFKLNQGGMSFHGGLLGVLIALFFLARSRKTSFFRITDLIAPAVPVGLGFGRIANFINGELWGKASTLPWAMIFPDPRAGGIARHPSQLYQFLLEGLLLFIILWLYSSKPRPLMAVSGLFLLAYGIARCCVEFVREPDRHLGYLASDWLTMGQVLSLPMIILGSVLMLLAYRKRQVNATCDNI